MKRLTVWALALCMLATLTTACGDTGNTIAMKIAKHTIEPLVVDTLQGIDPAQAQELITTRYQELIELSVTKFINDPEVNQMLLRHRPQGAILAAANELLAQTPADQG